MNSMLKCCDLTFCYSKNSDQVLKNINFDLKPGDFTMLAGPNGSGKSTLLKLLSGWQQKKLISGEITLDGHPLSSFSDQERARQIAVVPQTPPPAFDFTVREIVDMGRNPWRNSWGYSSKQDLEAVDEALAIMQLEDIADCCCSRLSGGERQRVAIASALAQRTKFLLLDEPTSALDPEHALMLLKILRGLADAPGCLIVTHDLHLALNHADKLVMLHHGEVFASGSPEKVLTADNLQQIYHCRAETAALPSGRTALDISLK